MLNLKYKNKIAIFIVVLFSFFAVAGTTKAVDVNLQELLDLGARTQSHWQKTVGGYLTTVYTDGLNILINGVNKYLNFGSTSGTSGYGFRDDGGNMEFKDSGGSWTDFGTGSGGGGSSAWEKDASFPNAITPTTTNAGINITGATTTILTATGLDGSGGDLKIDANGRFFIGPDADSGGAGVSNWREGFVNALTPTNTVAGLFIKGSSTVDSQLKVTGELHASSTILVDSDINVSGETRANVLFATSSVFDLLTVNGNTQMNGSASTTGDLEIGGSATTTGSQHITGDTFLNASTTAKDIFPETTNTYQLGDASNTWKNMSFTDENGQYFSARDLAFEQRNIADDLPYHKIKSSDDVTSGVWTVDMDTDGDDAGENIVLNINRRIYRHTGSNMTVDASAFAGTDASPNNVYIISWQSNGSPTLEATTTDPHSLDWDLEHIDLVTVKAGYLSDGSVTIYGSTFYKTQSYESLAKLIHKQTHPNAPYVSGMGITSSASDVTIASGEASWMVDDFDTDAKQVTVDTFFYIDSSGNYATSTTVGGATWEFDGNYSTGETIAANKFFNVYLGLVSAAVDNSDARLMALVQRGDILDSEYKDMEDCIADDDGARVTQPTDSILIASWIPVARLCIKQTATNALQAWPSGLYHDDVRIGGQSVGAGGAVTSNFIDDEFTIQDDGDATALMAFQVSGVTPGNTRTVTVQDSDGTMCLLEANQTFTGDLTFGTINATTTNIDTLTVNTTINVPANSIDFSDDTNATDGDGITFSGDAITADLGTAIVTGEITDGTILEVDLNISNSPTDNYILSYNSGSSNFTWAEDQTGGGLADINSQQLGQLSDVNTTTLAVASALMYDGSEWISYATTTQIMSYEIDTEAELESVSNITNILRETEIDASSEMLAIMDDETGTGAMCFATEPTFTTGINVNGYASSTSINVNEFKVGSDGNATSTRFDITDGTNGVRIIPGATTTFEFY